ncbi:MAG: ATP-dependent endonuclease [Proteobacteria bacterium]|nr:ATP-dependent endonuclease [Pseudomonadota bacterium]
MYLRTLTINNFRRLPNVTIEFVAGLNVLVGPNNVGKTAVVEALRALLAGADDPYPRFDETDLHLPKSEPPIGEIAFRYIFAGLSADDEADFSHALKPGADGEIEAHLGVSYGTPDKAGRFQVRRWCGDHQDVLMTSGMLENLRSVYLPPLRDATLGLRPSRTSQLSRLMHLLVNETDKQTIAKRLKTFDDEIKKHAPIANTQMAISTRHQTMLGSKLAQVLDVGLSTNDFQRLAARLSMLVDAMDIESNGLGYNNLIYMAVVLSELSKNADASFRSLIVEEPEAHLHPQLQAVLLRYLSTIEKEDGEKPVQVFVTSHSPNFASIAKLDSIACLVDVGTGIESFHPRRIEFGKGKREKLERYLDVTRAELFFARRVIFVEGAAELLLVNLMAKRIDYDLRDHAVSLISVEGLNFDSFLPLFGASAIKVPVAALTDADPLKIEKGADGKDAWIPVYPALGDVITPSDTVKAMKMREDAYVKIFHGLKTFEYDFALHAENRTAMLAALKEIHPHIALTVEAAVNAETIDSAKAKALFCGMFERPESNVQKGKFAQALAAKIEDEKLPFVVPDYIQSAIRHACS